MPRIGFVVSLLLIVAPAIAPADEARHFDRVVAPLLARRCLDCHSGAEPQGQLDLSRHAAALKGGESGAPIAAGKPDDSLLWKRIADGDMPPKKPLPEAERAILKAWIAGGAKWGTEQIDAFRYTSDGRAGYDWWSLQPVKAPTVPKLENTWRRTNAIDAFVQAKLVSKGLSPSTPADKRLLIRRLSIDLIGLPPTAAEVEAFLGDDSPQAYDRLVERLLASAHFGERWARHWLDVIRFGESQGFERDKLRTNSWRYRDWVVEAFNRDLPYADFVRHQLAGDVLDDKNPAAVAATGFLVAGPFDEVGKTQQSAAMKAVVRQDELEDIIGAVSQTFLGLTVNCARCHDHKFDPIRQREYYQLSAALAGVQHGERDLPAERVQQQAADAVKTLQARRQLLAQTMAAPEAEIRARLAAERKARVRDLQPPTPLAEWSFDSDAKDRRGGLHGELQGDAKLSDGRLILDGKTAYVATAPLEKDLAAKTLIAWVKLADLKKRSGGVFGVQSPDGTMFDGIVFAEQETQRWTVGSEFFRRTRSFSAPAEETADKQFVQIALTYSADGTIAAYRDGRLYGTPYKVDGLTKFAAGKAQVVFGLRHAPANPARLMAGEIDRAMLFDRALSGDEIALLAGVEGDVPEAEVIAQLSESQRKTRAAIQFELAHLDDQIKRWQQANTYAVAPQPPHKTHVLKRGEANKPGEEVAAGGIAAFASLSADFSLPLEAADGARRAKLAAWITDKHNPLAARVMVNRLWHHTFGVGLVDTPNDFGFNGGRPTHPELLDWLAAEFTASGGSVKHVLRLIVGSATYQQSSLPNKDALAKDADNRLLWRKSPQRLDAETLRDCLLAASGELNRDLGGPGFTDFRTFERNSQFYEVFDATGHSFHRRSLYRTWVRSGRSALLDVFDCPDPSTKTPARAVTTTPLQALALLNNPFVLRMCDATAERVKRDAGDTGDSDSERQVAAVYGRLFARQPTADERAATVKFAAEHGLAALVRVLVNSNEFLYVD